MRLFIAFLLLFSFEAFALDYEVIDVRDAEGQPYETGKIRVLSVHRLFTTKYNGLDMVELSGLAWSEDEQRLYAVSDHGSLFQFEVKFTKTGIADIALLDAVKLKNEQGGPVEYPWSDSEGLHIENSENGVVGDEELLISFENKPRLAWYRTNGEFLRKQTLPLFLQERASYIRRGKALESVTLHPLLGILTTPEYPLEKADRSRLILYSVDNKQYAIERDTELDAAVTAIESVSEKEVLVLMRKYQVYAPTWRTQIHRLILNEKQELKSELLADMKIGGIMPEYWTRHAPGFPENPATG